MTDAFALTVYVVLSLGTAIAVAALSAVIGRRAVGDEALIPYECGIDPVGAPRRPFSVKFFLIATLFVIFDVEIVFLLPWATAFRGLMREGWGAEPLIEGGVFLAILAAGLVYVWRAGALEWER